MNLRKFVSESLMQILAGVKDAQEAIINSPMPVEDKKYFLPYIFRRSFGS